MARKLLFGERMPGIKIGVPDSKIDALSPGVARHAKDSAHRRKLESRLEDREHFSRSVLDSLTANVAVIDEAGTITDVNRSWIAFAEANGDPPAEKIGVDANYFEVWRKRRRGPSSTWTSWPTT